MRRKHRGERAEGDDSYGHVLKYTGVFGGVQVLKILMDVVRNKLAALLLRTSGFGLNGIFMNIGEVVNSLTNFGIGFSSVQRLSELYEDGSQEDLRLFVGVVRTWSLLSALIGAVLCVCFSGLLDWYYFRQTGESHTLEIVFLSLYVASLPIEAGECSILKGVRQLKKIAGVELCCAVSTFVFTIPLFWLFGLRGIVLSLVLCGWAKATLHLSVSLRLFRYRVHPFSRRVVRVGLPLITKGVPYMLAAIAGSLTTALVFGFCLAGATSEIGLYKAGYGLMVTYAGMVFVAVEADYFPRLSSVNHDVQRMNHAINQQIDVCVLLMAPLLICFVLAMPWIVRLLYSHEFLPVVTMAQCAVFYMFFKAVTTPVAYTALAKGNSLVFLAVECVYNAVFVVLLYSGYHRWGLTGAGVSLSLAALFDLLMICSLYRALYRFRLRGSTLRLVLPQGLLLLCVVLASLSGSTLLKYSASLPCLALSLCLTWKMLRRR
ncbi:MAG: oligosaccharide flippase family protein [Prevotellaceae bacterium]|nr:oligosaccharide flippase family protein [Prevotellaceae bacterium]